MIERSETLRIAIEAELCVGQAYEYMRKAIELGGFVNTAEAEQIMKKLKELGGEMFCMNTEQEIAEKEERRIEKVA